MAAIGGFRPDLLITRKTDGNSGNVSVGVLTKNVSRKTAVNAHSCFFIDMKKHIK